MLDFENQDNAVYIAVYPFINLVASKEQGIKILEEASECREAYDVLAKTAMYLETNEVEDGDEQLQYSAHRFAEELCDTIQALINTLVAVVGTAEAAQEIINEWMYGITTKNAQRGYYGEFEEQEEEEQESEEDNTDDADGRISE